MVFYNFPGGAQSVLLGPALLRPFSFSDFYLVSFIMLVAVLAQQNPHETLFFFLLIYINMRRWKRLFFQVVVSRAHPRTVLALGRALRDAQCCWLECRRGQPHVKSAGDGFATTSAF